MSANADSPHAMRFDLITLFPEPLSAALDYSILKRAQNRGLIDLRFIDIREFCPDRHHTADDQVFGGGAGMLMKVEPLAAAIQSCLERDLQPPARVLLMTPHGRRLHQSLLEELSRERHLVLVCGRYEGVDDRVRSRYVTDEISIGDFVLTGGELAAAVVVDGVARLLPGVLGKDESSEDESFSSGLLEYPQYTRPPVFDGLAVPSILLSGNHGEIQKWRERQSLLRTAALRPDLLPPDWRDRLQPPRKPSAKRRRGKQPAPLERPPANPQSSGDS